MNARKTYEIVEINNRVFIIHLMPAAMSLAVLRELLTKALPVDLLSMFSIGDMNIGDKLSEYNLGNSSKAQMSMEEFARFQNKLLLNVQERLASMDQDVVDEVGNYLVEDLEFNLDLFMKLILKVVSVNYKDFFIDKLKQFNEILEKKDQDEQQNLIQSLAQSIGISQSL